MALKDSVKHAWHFNQSSGDAVDAVGGTTLTNVNTAPYVASPFGADGGNAADLEDTSGPNYFTATDPDFGEGANMSWMIWLQPESVGDDDYIFTKRVTTGNQRSFRFGISVGATGVLQFSISSDGTSTNEGFCTSGVGAVVAGEKHCYLIAFDGSQALGSRCKIYKDAVDITAADTTPATCFASTADFFVGVNAAGSLAYDGILDELVTWNRTLSAAEAVEAFNGGSILPHPFESTTNFFPFLDRR